MKHCANDACPDLARDGFRGEYQDHLSTCPTCAERLTEGPAPARSKRTEWVEQVQIATFPDISAAHVARMRLESAGIPADVPDESMQAIYPQAYSARLLVPSEHAEEARRILASDDGALVEDAAEVADEIDEETQEALAPSPRRRITTSSCWRSS